MSELAIGVFGASEFTLGFELAGVRASINTDGLAEQARVELLYQTMKRQDIGVLIADEQSLKGVGNHERGLMENQLRPVLIVLSKDNHDTGSLRRQIIRAIGVDVYEEKE